MTFVSPWEGQGIKSIRRFYLLKSRELRANGFEGLADVFAHKHASTSGTALPVDFVHLAVLADCGNYTTFEDLDGADQAELQQQGLTYSQAKAVLAEFSELTTTT